jgi:GlpG protein
MKRRRIRIDYNAPFCLTFALLAMGAYVSAVFTGGWSLQHVFSISGAASLADWTTWPRLFLHVLGHASAPHLFANLTVLLLVGPLLEEMYGPGLLLGLALVTAAITGLIMVLLLPGALLGASGIVFAFIILSSFANAKSGTIPLTFILICLIFIGGEVIRALGQEDQVAQFAHIAGGILGGFAGFWMARRAERPRW